MKYFLILIIIVGLVTLAFKTIINKSTSMQVSELKKLMEEQPGVVIDVRTRDEHEQGHLAITDALFDMLNGDFQRQIPHFDKNKTYYLYCRSGNRSGQAAMMMKRAGFENVFNIGGFDELVRAGFEPAKVETP